MYSPTTSPTGTPPSRRRRFEILLTIICLKTVQKETNLEQPEFRIDPLFHIEKSTGPSHFYIKVFCGILLSSVSF